MKVVICVLKQRHANSSIKWKSLTNVEEHGRTRQGTQLLGPLEAHALPQLSRTLADHFDFMMQRWSVATWLQLPETLAGDFRFLASWGFQGILGSS